MVGPIVWMPLQPRAGAPRATHEAATTTDG
jgi:hypothetical protein